jgi:uncharacterized membrane protein
MTFVCMELRRALGVFAIAATLLVLSLEADDLSSTYFVTEKAIIEAISNIGMSMVSYLVSFVFWFDFKWVFRVDKLFDVLLVSIVCFELVFLRLIPFASEVVKDISRHIYDVYFYLMVVGANFVLLRLANSKFISGSHLHCYSYTGHILMARLRAQLEMLLFLLILSIATSALHKRLYSIFLLGSLPIMISIRSNMTARKLASERK